MAEELCPVCGCMIAENAYEEDGKTYCCKPCASSSPCECGCCEAVEDSSEEQLPVIWSYSKTIKLRRGLDHFPYSEGAVARTAV